MQLVENRTAVSYAVLVRMARGDRSPTGDWRGGEQLGCERRILGAIHLIKTPSISVTFNKGASATRVPSINARMLTTVKMLLREVVVTAYIYYAICTLLYSNTVSPA